MVGPAGIGKSWWGKPDWGLQGFETSNFNPLVRGLNPKAKPLQALNPGMDATWIREGCLNLVKVLTLNIGMTEMDGDGGNDPELNLKEDMQGRMLECSDAVGFLARAVNCYSTC